MLESVQTYAPPIKSIEILEHTHATTTTNHKKKYKTNHTMMQEAQRDIYLNLVLFNFEVSCILF